MFIPVYMSHNASKNLRWKIKTGEWISTADGIYWKLIKYWLWTTIELFLLFWLILSCCARFILSSICEDIERFTTRKYFWRRIGAQTAKISGEILKIPAFPQNTRYLATLALIRTHFLEIQKLSSLDWLVVSVTLTGSITFTQPLWPLHGLT